MVLGLLTLHALGVLAFALTSFGATDSGSLAIHIWLGLLTVMFIVFSHTMSYFYLAAQTSVIRKAVTGPDAPAGAAEDPARRGFLARSRRLRSGTMPWAFGGMIAPMVVFILGGSAHTRALPPAVHATAGYLGLAFLLIAAGVVGLALMRQNRLLEGFQAAVGAARAGGPAGPADSTSSGDSTPAGSPVVETPGG